MATLERALRRPINGEALYLGVLMLLAGVIGLGVYAWFKVTTVGHVLTGLSDASPWGLYIIGFVFFVGASAGSTVIGLMIHAFGREDYARLGTRAILVGFLSLAAATTFIAVDVGSIPRMIQLPWVYRNPTSMFFYTSITYYLFGLILLGELYYTVKLTRGLSTARDKRIAKWLAILAVPFALGVLHAPHGALFAVVKAREFWNNPLLPPHFATVALVSGTALIILIAVATNKLGRTEIASRATLAHMGGLLAFFLAVAAFMDLFDFLVFTYSDNPTGAAAWDVIWGPQLGFSIVHVAGYVLAFTILLWKRRELGWLTAAAFLTIAGVAAYRYNLVTIGFAEPSLPFQESPRYWPSRYEIAISFGILALIGLSYLVLIRVLPMEESGRARWDAGRLLGRTKTAAPGEPELQR
jgi:molybdopterin-containing oxidoreductase family membrane subunit